MHSATTKLSVRNRGFTLLEIMLSMAFISVMAAIPLLLGNFSLSRSNLTHAESLTVGALRSAERFAIAEKDGGAWGAKVLPDSVTVFQGDTYDARDTAHDRIYVFPDTVLVSGTDEVVFAQWSGTPNNSGDIVLDIDAYSAVITVSDYGVIDYQP